MNNILVIGGGAAGTAAALSAAQHSKNANITILEGLDKVGKKILSTGNGRCNLTNTDISTEHYHSSNPHRLSELIANMPPDKAIDFFCGIGLYCTEEDMGRVYPYCRQASMVLDMINSALNRANINIIYKAKVKELIPEKNSWLAVTEQGKKYKGDCVILTTGGKASPKQGSTGSAYPITARLGHHYNRLYPCLVPVKSNSPALKSLKGIRIMCRSSLYEQNKKLSEQYGELQFTDYGLSGIPIFQHSCHLSALNTNDNFSIHIDLFPDWEHNTLRTLLQDRINDYPNDTADTLLMGLIPKKVGYAVMQSCGIRSLSDNLASISKSTLDKLITALKCWIFPITGTLSWDNAQVTGGGIELDEIDDNFQSQLHSGLYLAGELLDAVGDCGGYNLHWAWCSGITAGRAAAQL